MKNKRILSLFLCLIMFMTSINLNVFASGDVGTNPKGYSGIYTDSEGHTTITNKGGIKVSLMQLPTNEYRGMQDGKAILYEHIPYSLTSGELGDVMSNNKTLAKYAVAPIYFFENSNNYGVTKEITLGTDKNVKYGEIGNKVVTLNDVQNAINEAQISGDNKLQSGIKSALFQNSCNATSFKDVANTLGIVSIDNEDISNEEKTHNSNVLKTLLYIAKEKYANDSDMLNYISDCISNINNTILIIEPIKVINLKNGISCFATPLTVFNKTCKTDIYDMAFELMSAEFKTPNDNYDFDFIATEMIGARTYNYETNSFATRLHYTGPTGKISDNGTLEHAKLEDNILGFGCIAACDYIANEAVAVENIAIIEDENTVESESINYNGNMGQNTSTFTILNHVRDLLNGASDELIKEIKNTSWQNLLEEEEKKTYGSMYEIVAKIIKQIANSPYKLSILYDESETQYFEEYIMDYLISNKATFEDIDLVDKILNASKKNSMKIDNTQVALTVEKDDNKNEQVIESATMNGFKKILESASKLDKSNVTLTPVLISKGNMDFEISSTDTYSNGKTNDNKITGLDTNKYIHLEGTGEAKDFYIDGIIMPEGLLSSAGEEITTLLGTCIKNCYAYVKQGKSQDFIDEYVENEILKWLDIKDEKGNYQNNFTYLNDFNNGKKDISSMKAYDRILEYDKFSEDKQNVGYLFPKTLNKISSFSNSKTRASLVDIVEDIATSNYGYTNTNDKNAKCSISAEAYNELYNGIMLLMFYTKVDKPIRIQLDNKQTYDYYVALGQSYPRIKIKDTINSTVEKALLEEDKRLGNTTYKTMSSNESTLKTIASLNLMETIPSISAKIVKTQWAYKGSSVAIHVLSGNVGVGSTIYMKGIPMDVEIITKNKQTGNWELLDENVITNYTSAVANVLSTEHFNPVTTIGKTSYRIESVAIRPASVDRTTFANAYINAINNNQTSLKFNTIKSKINKMPLKYTYNYNGTTKTVNDYLLFTLTSEDEETYYKNKKKPAITIVVNENSGARQINVIDKADGTTIINEVTPNMVNNNVTLETKIDNSTLKEWVITNEQVNTIASWSDVSTVPILRQGTSSNNPIVNIVNTNIIYVHYYENLNVAAENGLVLSEKRITKLYDLTNISPLKEVKGSISSVSSHGSHGSGKDKTPCGNYMIDANYNHIYSNLNALPINTIASVSPFAPKGVNNVQGGTTSDRGLSYTLSPNYKFLLWRGLDKPTVASYVEGSNPLSSLGIGYSNIPTNTRLATGITNGDNISINIGTTSGSDKTTIVGRTGCSNSVKQTHTTTTAQYGAGTTIKSYHGTQGNGTQVASGNDNETLVIKDNGTNVTFRGNGTAVKSGTIEFYPYVQMAYDTIDGQTKAINVLATDKSIMSVNDYIFVGSNIDTNNTKNLTISSTQWSTAARALAVNNNRGASSVLPGGAIFTLSTNNANTKVGVAVYQTMVSDTMKKALIVGSDINTKANNNLTTLDSNIKTSLTNYDVVQYVYNKVTSNADEIFTNGVENKQVANQSVYGNQTSSYDKYYLKRNTNANSKAINEADLDLLSSSKTTDVIYTIKANYNGDITITSSKSGVIASCNKTQGINTLLANSEVKDLDTKTKVVTNFVNMLERNIGNDTTLSDPKWYNEMFEVQVRKTIMIYQVGFGTNSNVRTAALDPKLTPITNGNSDMYTKFYSSCWRVNKYCNTNSSVANYIGTYNGVAIKFNNIANMFRSKVYYIPNATVMDLTY